MPLVRSVDRRELLALALLAVTVVPTHADQCTGTKLRAVGKKEAALLRCQAKVAERNDTSGLSTCETQVRSKFSSAFGKAGSCGGDEMVCENIADNCENAVSAALTDAFPSECEATKRKAAGQLATGELRCYQKAATKGIPLETGCIPKVQGKFAAAMSNAGTCPDGGSPQTLVEDNCVSPAVTTDGGGMVTGICPSGTSTTTTTSASTTSTT